MEPLDPSLVPPQPKGPGLFALLVGGTVAYLYYRFNSPAKSERGEVLDEYDDDDDWSEPAPRAKPKRKRRTAKLADVVTDSLLDEPAVIADRGEDGDCYKAAKLLGKRRSLVSSKGDRKLFKRVVLTVAQKCRGSEDEIKDAIAEDTKRSADVEELFPESEGSSLPAKDISAAIETWLELDPTASRGEAERELKSDDEGDDFNPASPFDPSLRSRKSKTSTATSRSRGGRPAAATFFQKTRGGQRFKVTKEAAKTKRGYTLRKKQLSRF